MKPMLGSSAQAVSLLTFDRQRRRTQPGPTAGRMRLRPIGSPHSTPSRSACRSIANGRLTVAWRWHPPNAPTESPLELDRDDRDDLVKRATVTRHESQQRQCPRGELARRAQRWPAVGCEAGEETGGVVTKWQYAEFSCDDLVLLRPGGGPSRVNGRCKGTYQLPRARADGCGGRSRSHTAPRARRHGSLASVRAAPFHRLECLFP